MGLPRPQECLCFGGNCWPQFCPQSERNRKRRRKEAEQAETPPVQTPRSQGTH